MSRLLTLNKRQWIGIAASTIVSVLLDSGLAFAAVTINTNVQVGDNAGATLAMDGGDMFIDGTLEVDGVSNLGGAVTLPGSAGTTVFTVTAGDLVVSDGSLAITDADIAATLTITNATADTFGAAADNGIVAFIGDGLTTGTLLHLSVTEGTLANGFYLKAWDETADATVFSIGEDGFTTIAGPGDGSAALTLTTGDLTVSNGDLVVSGGDFNVTLDAGDGVNVAKGAAPTVDVVTIAGGSPATDGVDALAITLTTTDQIDFTNSGINLVLTSAGAEATDIARGIFVDLASTAGGTDTAIEIGTTAAFDVGLDLAGTKLELDADNDTSITADTDDTIDIEISGADDFQFTANTFTALAGSNVAIAGDDATLAFGAGTDASMLWETADADAHFFSIVTTGSNNIIVNTDTNTDWTHAASTNPTLWIQSADETTVADYISLSHDQTNASLVVGAGDLLLNIAGTNLAPSADDGAALGISGTAFSDLFLALGAVINFDGGDVTLTHAANSLAFAGGDLNVEILDGQTINLDGDATPTADILSVGVGDTSATDAADALFVAFTIDDATGDVLHLDPAFSHEDDVDEAETWNIIVIDALTATNSIASTNQTALLTGINLGVLTEAGTDVITSTGLSVGTGWDFGLDINSPSQFDGALTVGLDATGYDVKLFGDTTAKFMVWDQSADDLILADAVALQVGGDEATADGFKIEFDGTDTLDIWALTADDSITIGDAIDTDFILHSNSGVALTLDASANTITTAIAALFNGAITLGDTGADTITMTGQILYSVTAGVTAHVGSSQGDGAIAAGVDYLEIATTANAGDAVTLPTAAAGLHVVITNHGANAADVFPAADDVINEGGANVATSLGVNGTLDCWAYDATNWECPELAR